MDASEDRSADDFTIDIDPVLELLNPEPWSLEEIENGDANYAPLLSTLELDGGVTLRLWGVDDDDIALGLSGPDNGSIADALPQVVSAPSPLELVLGLAPKGAEVSPLLAEYSARAVEAGNWVPQAMGKGFSAKPSEPTKLACGGVTAAGPGNLESNAGNCSEFERDLGDPPTRWAWTDILAFAGNVVTEPGDELQWVVQRQNCFLFCSWTVLANILINDDEGLAHLILSRNIHNDFNIDSRVFALLNNTNHIHDVGRCHDYWGRNNAAVSTIAGGCFIEFEAAASTQILYCQEIEYENQEPSIMPTGPNWLGGGPFTCN